MTTVRVKICGLTRLVDVRAAVAAGANAIGMVFAKSPRQVSAEQAARLLAEAPRGVLKVGLFMNHERTEIERILSVVSLDMMQFHGSAENDWCGSFGLPYLKAVSVDSDRAAGEAKRYPDAAGILFDSAAPGGAGGTGRTFDWSLLREIDQPLWLAGGLDPDNVARAVLAVNPDWVDVSSGVEDEPGIKNAGLIRAFVEAAKSART